MRVALYSRCSTKKQDLDSQNKDLSDWANNNGYTFQLYEDLAISGRKSDRKGIIDLMIDARRHLFERVAVVELSRIGRSVGFICSTVKELSDLDIPIVLVNTNTIVDYKTLEGSALVNALAMAADIEWRLIAERNERGREKIRRDGIRVGRKHKVLSNEAILALTDKGMSLREIAREFNVSAPTIMRRLSNINGHLCNVTQTNQNNMDFEQKSGTVTKESNRGDQV